jgi:predicted deacylase
VLCRTVEELAVRLSNCERHWRQRDWEALRKCAKSLVAIADQIGMTALARVAGDVTGAVDAGDAVAAGATLGRLIRVGERSLTAIWDQQDLSV